MQILCYTGVFLLQHIGGKSFIQIECLAFRKNCKDVRETSVVLTGSWYFQSRLTGDRRQTKQFSFLKIFSHVFRVHFRDYPPSTPYPPFSVSGSDLDPIILSLMRYKIMKFRKTSISFIISSISFLKIIHCNISIKQPLTILWVLLKFREKKMEYFICHTALWYIYCTLL